MSIMISTETFMISTETFISKRQELSPINHKEHVILQTFPSQS